MTIHRRFLLSGVALALSGFWSAGAPAQSKPESSPARDLVVDGERFVKRVISDPGQGGMTAATIHVPEAWRFESKIEWHYGWVEYPLSVSAQAENPTNAEAYFDYPLVRLETTDVPPNLRQFLPKPPNPGERLPTGALWLAPRPPQQALALFIQKVRVNLPKFRWIGKQDLPDLVKALGIQPWPNDHGIAVKIGYELNGQPVEEAFFGVYYLSKQGNPGDIQQTNWGFRALRSFRAPEGTLEKRMPVFCAIAKSVNPDPKWAERTQAINARLVALFNQRLKEGYDQMAAAQRLSEQVMKNQEEFSSSVNAWILANRENGGSRPAEGTGKSAGGGRSAADLISDQIKGVDTVKDPLWGTSQHSYTEQYHYTDGFGNYKHTNDPNANLGPDWQLMQSP
jgi:hypothetical protein